MYTYYRDLKPMIENPESHAEKISEIIEAAKKAPQVIESFHKVLANPFNAELFNANPRGFIMEQTNLLWSAANLMLAIPSLKNESNMATSLSYLEKATSQYNYAPAWSRLGWCYSQGVENLVEVNYEKAIECFKKSAGYGFSWNTVGWCYEKLNKFSEAKEAFNKTLEKDPENESALRHIKSCSEMIASNRLGLFSEINPKPDSVSNSSDSKRRKLN